MIKPVSFVRLTPLYVLLCLFLIDLSLILKLFNMPYRDLLLFIAFPSLIMGTLFQMYPTLQGMSIRGNWLTYLHLLLTFINLILFLWKFQIFWLPFMSLSLLSFFFLALNTKNLKDPLILFFLLGGAYFALSSLFMFMKLSPTLIKHTITAGFFMNVIIGAYYVFVPMLQIEEIKHRRLVWWNLILYNLSLPLFLYSWHRQNLVLLAHSGLLLLLSCFLLAFVLYVSLIQRKSPLKGLDISVQYLLLGLFMVIFFMAVGIASAGSGNYGFLSWHWDGMLYGFLTFITVGASYHIVPFLLWWRAYASMMGRQKIPTLKELLGLEVPQRVLFIGLPLLVFGLITEPFNPYLSRLFYFALLLVKGYYTLKLLPLAYSSIKT